jgi:hypothetical protein
MVRQWSSGFEFDAADKILGWADCFTQDFSREDLRDLELAARFWPASPVIQSN